MPRLLPVFALTAALLPAALASTAAAQAPTSFGDEPGALRLPEAVAVVPDGTVLVGDHFSGRIQLFRDGKVVPGGGFGLSGEVCGRLGSVSGIARAGDGRIYVFDSDNQRVQVFGADGRVQRCWGRRGLAAGQFKTSSGSYAASTGEGGVAVDARYVYVADTGNNRVQRFTLDGREPKVLAKGKLQQPQGLAIRDGRLLVADDGNHRVVELDPRTGRIVRTTARGLVSYPYDVAIAPGGHAYVADNNGHRIVRLDKRLKPVRAWGTYGRRPGQLVYPRAVAIAPGGNVVVADPGNDRVTEYTASGRYVRTLGVGGRADGRLTAPLDVAVNGSGEVAVADSARIAWFGLDGGRWLGRWAQGRSFQDSTATVMGPSAIAFAAPQRVLVNAGGQLRRYGAGEAKVVAGGFALGQRGPAQGAFFPRSLAVDGSGATWALTQDGQPVPVGADGKPGTPLGAAEPPDRTVTDVAVLGDGTVAATEGGRQNIPNPADGTIVRRDAASGAVVSTWKLPRPASVPEPQVPGGERTVPASKPAGIVPDGAGGAWVSDAAHGRVVRFDAGGNVVATLGTPGAGDGQLAEPRGLALACDGSLLVADTGNNRVVRFPGVAAAAGCAALPSPVTARVAIPRPAGLKLRTRDRAGRPARILGRVTTSCVRTCTIAAQGSVSASAGRENQQLPLEVRRAGRTLTLVASAKTQAAMRAALRRNHSYVAAALSVTATTADGVVDTDAVTLRITKP